MKKSFILSSLALASIGFFAFQTEIETSIVEEFSKDHLFIQGGGNQSGLTGAPGEQNCTLCHSGGTLAGAAQNNVQFLDGFTPVTEYTPGVTYNVTLALASGQGKGGFSSTALDDNDVKAGTLSGATIGGTQNFDSAGRDYVSHTVASNGAGQWSFTWTAPALGAGDVTFYVASNQANDDGSTSGDMIYLSEHIFSEGGTGIKETSIETNFTAGYNAASNKLMLDFNSLTIGEMNLNLVDMNGRSVFTYSLGASESGSNNETITLPSSLNEGMYVVHFFIGNKAMSANILVKK